jgi:hypothetical protein
MLKKQFSQKLRCACMGIALGLAAVVIYMIFLIAYQAKTSEQMMLIPILTVAPATSGN